MDEKIKLVKEGYEIAAEPYLKQKDDTQHKLQIFQDWLNKVLLMDPTKGNLILELGCASGFPIGNEILNKISERNSKFEYIGIDLSSKQIQLAHEKYPEHVSNYIEAEMVEYLGTIADNSVSGIVSMFSIRHVPRIYHVQLFQEIKRVLQPGGYFIMDCVPRSDDGSIEENWLGAKMYWSTFSREWTELTLKEIGFSLEQSEIDEKEFFGETERTLYFLLRK